MKLLPMTPGLRLYIHFTGNLLRTGPTLPHAGPSRPIQTTSGLFFFTRVS